jgi:uncharacterized protein (DUF488 family)
LGTVDLNVVSKSIFTIGHSNHPIERFLALLNQHQIDVVVDVRSVPFSKFSVHFDHDALQKTVRSVGRKYLYLGREVGGMPRDRNLYDEEGNVLFSKIAASVGFKQGIERLLKGISQYRVVLMCGEENPTQCHRRLLIGTTLAEHGINVIHIRGDGTSQSEAELDAETAPPVKQMSLF